MAFRQLPPALNEQAQRQLVTYWRVRIGKTLEQLESEVSRMLRVEHSLERFARDMVARLGPSMEIYRTLPASVAETVGMPKAPFAWVEQGVANARARELKSRYRQLAKELHPDYATHGEQPSMVAINHAYDTDNLAAMVRLEAQALAPEADAPSQQFEDYVKQVDQATQTYRYAYNQLLNSPLYSLYARATSAQEDGWDYVESLARRVKRAAEGQAVAAA